MFKEYLRAILQAPVLLLTSGIRLPTFTSDSVRDEAGVGEGVKIFSVLDDLLIYWGLSEVIHSWRRGGIKFCSACECVRLCVCGGVGCVGVWECVCVCGGGGGGGGVAGVRGSDGFH